MPRPILIDTDMGIDDALAIALALSSPELEIAGIVSVSGNVPLERATSNIGRVLTGLGCGSFPPVGRGLSQHDEAGLRDARHVFGHDGLGETGLPETDAIEVVHGADLYRQLIEKHGTALTVLAIGPLTNLAELIREQPGLMERTGRVVVMGGAVWCPGNVNPHAEFNFYRDPAAAAVVLSAGLPVTVVPLDITRQVAFDESHVARLAGSGTPAGELLARMIAWPLQYSPEAGEGKFLIHDATALAAILWPELFLRAVMGLDVVTTGPQAGKSRPLATRDRKRQVHVLISVNALDLLEKITERLTRYGFIV